MTDQDEIYRELILDHGSRPRNVGELPGATAHADGHNRVCGDRLRVYVKLAGDVVEEVAFAGDGCQIFRASASMMTEAVKGRRIAEVRKLFDTFHRLLTESAEDEIPAGGESLGKLLAFAGVQKFPIRVKCATLAWHTLAAALDGGSRAVSTE